jgi:hypothetical protein
MFDNNPLITAKVFENMMTDETFRNVMGMKLLMDENKANDGIGLALLSSSNTPLAPSLSPMLPKLPNL